MTLDAFTSISCLPNRLVYPNNDTEVYAFNWNDLFKLSTNTDLKLNLQNNYDCYSIDDMFNDTLKLCAGKFFMLHMFLEFFFYFGNLGKFKF